MANARRVLSKVVLEGREATADTSAMRSTLVRLVLLRFVPGRLIAILTLLEVVRLVRRLRRRGDRNG